MTSASVRPYERCLVDSESHVLRCPSPLNVRAMFSDVLDPLSLTNFPLLLLQESLSSTSCLTVGLCLCSHHQMLDDASLITIRLGKNLWVQQNVIMSHFIVFLFVLFLFCQSCLALPEGAGLSSLWLLAIQALSGMRSHFLCGHQVKSVID